MDLDDYVFEIEQQNNVFRNILGCVPNPRRKGASSIVMYPIPPRPASNGTIRSVFSLKITTITTEDYDRLCPECGNETEHIEIPYNLSNGGECSYGFLACFECGWNNE